MSLFTTAMETVCELQPRRIVGRVRSLRGLTLIVDQLRVPIGSIVCVETASQQSPSVRGEVVGFQGDAAIVMLYDDAGGIAPGDDCVGERNSATVQVGGALLGRVVDGLGRPLDGRDVPTGLSSRLLHPSRVSPLDRESITQPIATGIRTIDGLHTVMLISGISRLFFEDARKNFGTTLWSPIVV